MKRFPTLPPFGKRWFRIFKEPEHILAILRRAWMFENIQLDLDQDAKIRNDSLEYLAFFSNPKIFQQVKGLDKDNDVQGDFQIVKTTEVFDRRLKAAVSGSPELPERDEYIDYVVNRIKEFRAMRPDIYGDDDQVYMTEPEISDPLIVEHKE